MTIRQHDLACAGNNLRGAEGAIRMTL